MEPERKPVLAIFDRHSLIDGRGASWTIAPGDERGHPFLGSWPHNIGDQFVASGLGRALDVDEFYTITREATPEQFAFVNETCKAVIVVAQNAMQPGWFARHLPISYLRQLKIPLIFFSLGLQFRFGEDILLTPEDVEVLRYLHDHCVSSQVRGAMSAELLERYGIRNARVLGCPSLLFPGTPNIRVRAPSLEDVSFTITDMGRLPHLHAFQFEIMEDLLGRAGRFSVVGQGGEWVLQAFVAARDGVHPSTRIDSDVRLGPDGPVLAARGPTAPALGPGDMMHSRLDWYDLDELGRSLDWYYRDASESLRRNIKARAFFSTSLPDYVRRARDQTLYAGTRLHGNLIALTQGTPTVFAVHDYRLKDMVEFLRLPHVSYEAGPRRIALEDCDFTGFEALMPDLWNGFCDFFEENGLAHRLTRTPIGNGTQDAR
ncbi:polysaccharide pyruvyl transferase family protein [Salinarimonas sp.]|uniref:polysaccharide pyruvyl transferase family protein n=1 Tax=Salinarimonas sp. TaxID=2766526 RepID=UPI0032D8B8FA